MQAQSLCTTHNKHGSETYTQLYCVYCLLNLLFYLFDLFKLPLNFRERLGDYLPHDEIHRLENAADAEAERKTGSLFKIPMFQPTAAAAIMYNMQNVTIKQHNQRHSVNPNETKKDNDLLQESTVPATLIARVLKKDTETRQKLFPYVCTKCKTDKWPCDSSTQTHADISTEESCDDKIMYANKDFNSTSLFNRTKSLATSLNEFSSNKILTINEESELQNTLSNTNQMRSKANRSKLDSWTDLDVDSINYK
jgi:hypothetical protein